MGYDHFLDLRAGHLSSSGRWRPTGPHVAAYLAVVDAGPCGFTTSLTPRPARTFKTDPSFGSTAVPLNDLYRFSRFSPVSLESATTFWARMITPIARVMKARLSVASASLRYWVIILGLPAYFSTSNPFVFAIGSD